MKSAAAQKFDQDTAAFDWDRAMAAEDFFEFDDAVTAPLHGFTGVEDYYGTCSYGELRGLSLSDGERVWEDKEITRQGRWGSMFWVKHKDRYFVFL